MLVGRLVGLILGLDERLEGSQMKVGDLVKENWGLERVGIVVAEVPRPPCRSHRRLFKVLWDTLSPANPTLIGPLWETQAEVINESR